MNNTDLLFVINAPCPFSACSAFYRAHRLREYIQNDKRTDTLANAHQSGGQPADTRRSLRGSHWKLLRRKFAALLEWRRMKIVNREFVNCYETVRCFFQEMYGSIILFFILFIRFILDWLISRDTMRLLNDLSIIFCSGEFERFGLACRTISSTE